MFIGLALLLAVVWLLSLVVFKVSAAAIHLLILAAVVSFIAHVVSRGRRVTT
jgi:hypothetical protein